MILFYHFLFCSRTICQQVPLHLLNESNRVSSFGLPGRDALSDLGSFLFLLSHPSSVLGSLLQSSASAASTALGSGCRMSCYAALSTSLGIPLCPYPDVALAPLGFSMGAQIQSLPSAPGGSCSRGWAGLCRRGVVGRRKGTAVDGEQAGAWPDVCSIAASPVSPAGASLRNFFWGFASLSCCSLPLKYPPLGFAGGNILASPRATLHEAGRKQMSSQLTSEPLWIYAFTSDGLRCGACVQVVRVQWEYRKICSPGARARRLHSSAKVRLVLYPERWYTCDKATSLTYASNPKRTMKRSLQARLCCSRRRPAEHQTCFNYSAGWRYCQRCKTAAFCFLSSVASLRN